MRRGKTEGKLNVHFYKAEYRLLEKELKEAFPQIRPLSFYGEVICGPFGSEITTEDYRLQGVPLLRIGNITDEGQIDTSELVFISEELSERLSSTQIRPNDLVVSQRGTLGMPAIVPSNYQLYNISANLLAVRNLRELNPEFVQLYLSSRSGARQLERKHSGQVQAKITTDDLASVLVPLLKNQDELVRAMNLAREARQRRQAEATALLSGLDGWALKQLDLTLPSPKSRRAFAVRRDVVIQTARLNADYFHPERLLAIREIEEHSRRLRPAPLSEVVNFIRDLRKAPEGTYIGLAHLQSHTGELVEVEEEAEGSCLVFEEGDVLFARLRPYLNKVYRAEFPGVCSTEFHVMRIKDENLIIPDYLAVVLRSSVILAQTRHMMTGNTHPRLTNEDVENLVIPIPEPAVQKSVASEAKRRREQARQLRAEAEAEWQTAKDWFEAQLLGEA